MELPKEVGYIEVVCGPMFAGKSEELIRRINRLEYAKKNVLVFKYNKVNKTNEIKTMPINHHTLILRILNKTIPVQIQLGLRLAPGLNIL